MPNPNKLKHQIIKKGVTQREMAKSLGIQESYLSRMCNEHVNLSEDYLARIANYLDCEVADIIGED